MKKRIEGFGKAVIWGAGLSLILFIFIVATVVWSYQQSRDQFNWALHSQEVLTVLSDYLSGMQDAETGQRGFLLTGDENYLEPFNNSLTTVRGNFEALRNLTSDNPNQQARLARIAPLMDAKFEELQQTISLRREVNLEAALEVVRSDRGKIDMDNIRVVVAEMKKEEERLIVERQSKADNIAMVTVISQYTGFALILILGTVVVFRMKRDLAERKRAEEELQQQLLVNKTITDNTASCLFMMDKRGRATFMNPAAEAVTGYTLDEIREMPLHDAIHYRYPDGRPYPMSECPIDNAQAELVKMVDYEDIFVRKDGSLFPVLCYIEPLEKDGEVIGAVLEFQDVTERKRAEEELQQQLLVNKTITDNTASCLFMMDKRGRATFMNPAAEAVTGYTLDEIREMPLHDAIHYRYPDGRPYPMSECPIDNAQAELVKMVDYEDIFVRKDGSLFPVLCYIEPLEKDGEVIGAVLEFQDVTERKQAEEALRANKDELEKQNWLKTALGELNDTMRGEMDPVRLSQSIINYLAECLKAPIGALYLRENGSLNLTASYAYTRRKELSNTFQIGESLVGQAALEMKNIVVTEAPEDYIKVQSGLGNAAPRNILIVPFLYEGQVMGVIELGTFEDINDDQMEFLNQATASIAINLNSANARSRLQELLTETQAQAEELTEQQEEMRQQQEEMRQTNRYLEEQTQTLEKQKREIENKNKLIQVKAEELELSDKYKSEFLANMSHELRTPLNSLLILSQLLGENKEKNLTEKQIEFAKTIQGSGADLLNLIDDILDLSKVESGKMEVHVQEINLREWANRIENNFAHVATEKGLSLNIEVGDGIPVSIVSDVQRLDQIIKNLLSNAFKFTDEGGVTLRIQQPGPDTVFSRPGLDPGSVIAVSVSDTGQGIAPDKQTVIFEAFQQEDGTTSRKFGGTGLGLSITRELVKLLGGEIRLQSQPGKGSTFTIYLPWERREGQPPAPALSEAKDPTSGQEVAPDAPRKTGEKIPLLVVEDDARFGGVVAQLAHQKGFESLVAPTGELGFKYSHSHRPKGIILDLGLPGMDGLQLMNKLKKSPYTRDIHVCVISGQGKEKEAMAHGALGYLEKPVTQEQLKEVFAHLESSIVDKPKTVLVVEDDPVLLKSTQEVLGKIENTEIIGVSASREALDLLTSRCIDCLILDLGLPEESGGELLDQIKYDEILKFVPVIIYTGRELSREQESSLKKYSKSIIIKGAGSPDRLLDEVKVFLYGLKNNLLVIAEEEASKKKTESELDLIGKTILLVDDDMRNAFALTNVLEEKGLSVTIGKNGLEALEQLKEEPGIDLVLMDIMMPDMDGFEAIKRIRQDLKLENLPIIAVTAKAMKGDRKKCLDAGANDYMTKPIQTEELLSKIHSWLKDS